MTDWTNHVTVLANAGSPQTVDPANPTASGTVQDGAAFTPTAGRLLICVVAGPVTSTTPSGWTLPSGGSAVSTEGVYVFHKTAAGSDTITTSHNSPGFKVTFDFYEFASAASFVKSAGFTGVTSGTSKSLTGLTGTNLVMVPVAGPSNGAGFTFGGATSQVDYNSGAGGHRYALGYVTSSASSVAVSATLETHEQLMFAITGLPSPTISGTFAAELPLTEIAFTGTYTPPTVTGTFAATLPTVEASFTGTWTPAITTGTFAATLPLSEAAFTGTYVPPTITGTLAASLPLLQASFTGTPPTEHGTLAAVLPTISARFDGAYLGPYPTDTSNDANGRDRRGTATVVQDIALTPPPATRTLAQRFEKAIALPTPTMVDGRPT